MAVFACAMHTQIEDKNKSWEVLYNQQDWVTELHKNAILRFSAPCASLLAEAFPWS